MFSFIVPVYKVETYLRQCIESVVTQTVDDWELLLIDDGSPDACGAICDEYSEKDTRIHVIHQKNSGVAVARNEGLKQAKGEWILFVDADDWVDRDLCEQLEGHLTDDMDICYFSYVEEAMNKSKVFGKQDREKGFFEVYDKEDITHMQKAILYKHMCKYTSAGSPWAKVYRRSFLEEHQLRYHKGMVKGQDRLYNLEAYEYAMKGGYLNISAYHYRITAASIRHRYNPDIIEIIRKQYQLMHECLIKIGREEEFEELYYKGVYRSFMIDSMIDFCHKDNPKSYKQRKQEYLATLDSEPFRTAIRQIDVSDWPQKEQLLSFLIKHHMFGAICLLYWLKNQMYKAQ